MGRREIIPVRVWMGYALSGLEGGDGRQRFYRELGRVFMPATVQMMAPLGLTAYVPGVVPPARCADVPDEVALVFYESFDAYEKACVSSTAGRAYGLLHQTVFDFRGARRPPSHSGFPSLFEAEAFAAGQIPYASLFSADGNWQEGVWQTAVAVLGNADCDVACARRHLSRRLAEIQAAPPEGLTAAFTAVQGACIVIWTQWSSGPAAPLVEDLPGLQIHCNLAAAPAAVPMDLAAQYDGIDVGPGSSFSFQFKTRTGKNTGREKQCLSD